MKFKLFTVFIATIFLLMGCLGTNNNQEGRGDNSIYEGTNYNDGNITRKSRDRNFTDNVGNDRNSNNRQDRYEVSDEAAERIVAEIPEIDRAYVLTTRNNAYVAAGMNADATTPKDNLTYNDRQNSSAGMNIRNVNDRNVTNRTVNEGDSNERRQDNHMANRRAEISDDVEKKSDVESDEVTDDVKNKIADIVQDVDNNIDNVYVSTNPDFLDLTSNYVGDMRDGKPIRGFFDQIGNTIERIFPQNKR